MKLLRSPWTGWPVIMLIMVGIGCIDWLTGYEIRVFAFYFIPVALAAWSFGLGATVVAAVLAALVWFGSDMLARHSYANPALAVWNTAILLSALLAIGWAIQKIRALLDAERKATAVLRQSLAEIKVLEGILPICAQCKQIRDDGGQWQAVEVYVRDRTEAQFSHTYCPECAKRALEDAGF
jgi:glucose-6-phosphate-specific signal transduction histidine kinase